MACYVCVNNINAQYIKVCYLYIINQLKNFEEGPKTLNDCGEVDDFEILT